MELSKKTQTMVALFSGVILGALLVFMFMQNYYQSKISQQTAVPQAETQRVANEQVSPDTTTPQAPAESTQAPEPVAPAQPETTSAPTRPAETATLAAHDTAAYNYTARPGDAYSILARKAVQTYGLQHRVALSLTQIVAAEAYLTTQAGSPELNEGQQVTIATDSVKSAVETAQKMSADESAAWQAYVYDVDFNTNDNG